MRLQSSGGVRSTLKSTGNAKPRVKKEANGVEAFAYSTRETCSTGLAWPTAFAPLSFLLSIALSVSRVVLLQLESNSRKRTRTAQHVNESKGLEAENAWGTQDKRGRSSFGILLYRKSTLLGSTLATTPIAQWNFTFVLHG